MQKKIRKILITSILANRNKTNVSYFYYRRNGEMKVGSRIARLEAAAFSVMAENALDEIIVVGRKGRSTNAQDNLGKCRLSREVYPPEVDGRTLSDYGFFKYRLHQFTHQRDIEGDRIRTAIPEMRQEELAATVRVVLGEDLSTGFQRVHDDCSLLEKIYQEAQAFNQEEQDWIKRFLYDKIHDKHRVASIWKNADVEISFLPIIEVEDEKTTLTNISELMEMLDAKEDEEVVLFLDIQSFSLVDGYVFFNYLKLKDISEKNNLRIETVLALNKAEKAIAQRLFDTKHRFRVNDFMAGVEAFVNYGKVDLIRRYWERTENHNEYIDKLLYAMSKVDTGLSLCHSDEVIAGIKMFVNLMNDSKLLQMSDFSTEEASFIYQVRETVLADYDGILDDNGDLNLDRFIKWEYSKELYQQAMTMIESKLPRFLSQRGVFYYARCEEDLERSLELFNKHFWQEDPRFKYTFDDIDHWIIKDLPHDITDFRDHRTPASLKYARSLMNCLEDNEPHGIRFYSVVDDKEALKDLLVSYFEIGSLRNAINHAEENAENDYMIEDYTKPNPYIDKLATELKKFIYKLDRVLENADGKAFYRVEVSAEERMEYYNSHKLESNRRHGRNRRGRGGGGNRNNGNHAQAAVPDIHIHLHMDK